jgi:hypothetical protein
LTSQKMPFFIDTAVKTFFMFCQCYSPWQRGQAITGEEWKLSGFLPSVLRPQCPLSNAVIGSSLSEHLFAL